MSANNGFIAFDKWVRLLSTLLEKPNNRIELKVIGESMAPTLLPGVTVTVKKCIHPAKVGDIIVYKKWDSNLTIHRIVRVDNNNGNYQYTTKGDGNYYIDDYTLLMNEVIGVVCL